MTEEFLEKFIFGGKKVLKVLLSHLIQNIFRVYEVGFKLTGSRFLVCCCRKGGKL